MCGNLCSWYIKTKPIINRPLCEHLLENYKTKQNEKQKQSKIK